MRRRAGPARAFIALCGLLTALAGCAGHVAPPPVIQVSPLTGRLTTGVIVSVRNIDPDLNPAITDSILTALGQMPVKLTGMSATEIVIRRPDQTGTSIVETAQPNALGYGPGEKIAIVEAAVTVIHPE